MAAAAIHMRGCHARGGGDRVIPNATLAPGIQTSQMKTRQATPSKHPGAIASNGLPTVVSNSQPTQTPL
jgi:hypothetical protein